MLASNPRYLDVVEAFEEGGHSGLASARGADEGHHATGSDLQVEALQHRLSNHWSKTPKKSSTIHLSQLGPTGLLFETNMSLVPWFTGLVDWVF